MKLPGEISLRKLLPIWAMPKGRRLARDGTHVLEVDEDALRRLGAQIDHGRVFFDGAHEGLEHQIELARLGQLAAAVRAAVALQVVGAEAHLALFAIDQRIGELSRCARRLSRPRAPSG